VSHRYAFSTTIFSWFILAGLLLVSTLYPQRAGAEENKPPLQNIRIPLAFEPNLGQAENGQVRFLAHSRSGQVYLTQDGAILQSKSAAGHALRLYFDKAKTTNPLGESPTGGVANYYQGHDRGKWLTGIPMVSRVRYPGIYPGIDAVFHGNGDQLEYDFEVKPTAAPEAIAFRFDGDNQLHLTADGALEIQAEGESWNLLPPVAYQMRNGVRQSVRASYEIARNHTVRLRLGVYDRSNILIIDPVVQFAGIFSLNGSALVNGLQLDALGNIIFAGTTFATNYPVVNGRSVTASSGSQVYVTKLNPAGDTILFSTYIPSSGFSNLSALALDPSGNIYITGVPGGSDYPVTTSALGTTGGFLTKLSPAGAISYSGTMSGTFPRALTVDAAGNAFVTGEAGATISPGIGTLIPVNAFQSVPPCPNCSAPFFVKVNPAGTGYVFSSYFYGLTGSETLSVNGIGLDGAGNLYLAGSAEVPHVNPWQIGGNLFVSKLSPDGQTLLFSTDFGTSSESLSGMEVASDGTIYLVGTTPNNDYPYAIDATRHPVGPTGPVASPKIFATAINSTLTGLNYSTYIADGVVGGISLAGNGHLYITGVGGVLPTQNAIISDLTGGGFYVELDPLGVPVTASQYGGHGGDDQPSGIAVDGTGDVFLAGITALSSGSPGSEEIMVGPFRGTPGTPGAVFFSKISPTNTPQISVNTGSAPFVSLRNVSTVDLHITSATFSGGSVFGNCGAVVPAGTSCVMTVASSAGTLAAGTLTISSDANPGVQTFGVPLSVGQRPGDPIGDFLLFEKSAGLFGPFAEQSVSFRIANVGTATAVINQITTSAGTTQTNNCGASLAAGAGCTVQLTIPGSDTASSLTVIFDNTQQQSFSFFSPSVSGNPILSIAGINFPLQFVGGVSLPRTITVTNTGNLDITVPAPILTGDPQFSVAGDTCPNPLPSHQSCVIGVLFTPTLDSTPSATLNIGSNTVQLSGRGQINSAIQISPLEVDFAPHIVHAGGPAIAVTLTNSLANPVPISNIIFSNADFSQTNDCAGQVPASGSCTVQIAFVPQAPGQRKGTMTINFNGATTQIVTVTGISETPFSVSPGSLNFSAGVGHTSAEQFISIGNRSTATQAYTFTVTGDFAIAQNPCVNPLPANGLNNSGCAPAIVFQPTALGPAQGTFTVNYAGFTETDVVTLTGVASNVAAAPLQLNFPTTTIGQSSTLDVTLTNSGATAVGITGIFESAGDFGETNTCQGQVPANGTCTIHVIFSPRFAAPESGSLTVSLADSAQYTISFSGTGTGPQIAFTFNSLDFGGQIVNTTSNAFSFSMINGGNAPLLISNISISGDFTQTNDCPTSLKTFCTISVKFSPTATGTRSGSITITDNGLGSPQQIPLSGIGTDFQVGASTASATVIAGQRVTYNLTASGDTGFLGPVQFACSGVPAGATCIINPSSVSLNGTIAIPFAVVIQTSAHASALQINRPGPTLWAVNLASIVAFVPLMLFLRKRGSGARLSAAFACLGMIAILTVAGCGGGGSNSGTPPPTVSQGTPAGTYTISIVGTGFTGNGLTITRTTNLTLVVQ